MSCEEDEFIDKSMFYHTIQQLRIFACDLNNWDTGLLFGHTDSKIINTQNN